MANQQLVDYIRQQIAAGMDKNQIMQSLAETGWASSDILEAMLAVVGTAGSSTFPTPQMPAPQNVPRIRLVRPDSPTNDSIVAFLVAGIISLAGLPLVVLFKFVGVFPASWSWGAILGGLVVFLLISFFAARFLGTVAVILLFSLTLSLGGFYIVFGIPMLQHAAQQDALKNGVSGTAMVTAANFDGFINYQSEFTITLQVTPQSGVPFAATTMVFGDGSSQTAPYSVGTKVDVKYVPTNHDVVIVGPSS